MRNFIHAALLTLLSMTLAGCQTSRFHAFEKVKEGQTKTTVLESVGGPDRTIREEGKDRWIYVFYDKDLDNPEWKELQFIKNKVVYIGDRVKPELSAIQADEKAAESNRAEQARLDGLQKENDRRMGRINTPAYGKATVYQDDEVKDAESEKYKHAPNFEPIK